MGYVSDRLPSSRRILVGGNPGTVTMPDFSGLVSRFQEILVNDFWATRVSSLGDGLISVAQAQVELSSSVMTCFFKKTIHR